MPPSRLSPPGRPWLLLLLMSGAATLAGCHPGRPRRVKLPPALSSALATGEALNAAGEQPDWSLQIRPRGLSFGTNGGPMQTAPNPGPAAARNGAVWSAPLPDGRTLQATVTASACHDAATGLSFPFTAEVETGGTTYRGCAAAAGQGLGPRG